MSSSSPFLHLFALLAGTGVLGLSLALLVYGLMMKRRSPYPDVQRFPSETFFRNPGRSGKKKVPVPDLNDDATVTMSIVVPAYNEEQRLPPMLDECLEVMEQMSRDTKDFTYEVIVVNDGSTDGTVKVVMDDYVKKWGVEKVRLLDLEKNRGKGGAVRLGIESSRGRVILFADADGATHFPDVQKLLDALWEVKESRNHKGRPEDLEAIVIGSRAHLEEESIATRSLFRTILMRGFHFLVYIFTVRGVQDTQCGFKLFTRAAARKCFPNLHIERWAFDVELLCIAQTLGIPISEVAVNWTEIEGSKVTPVWSWIQMGRDLFLIWFHYRIGAWKLRKE